MQVRVIMCCSRKYPYPSHRRFFKFETPHPARNSILVSYFCLKNWAFETPLPLGISVNLPWGRHGYFLELHNGVARGEMFICSKLRQNLSEMEVRTFVKIQRVIWGHLLASKAEIIQTFVPNAATRWIIFTACYAVCSVFCVSFSFLARQGNVLV